MAEVTVKNRINKFDNLRGLAIILIVLGHMTLYRKVDSMASSGASYSYSTCQCSFSWQVTFQKSVLMNL